VVSPARWGVLDGRVTVRSISAASASGSPVRVGVEVVADHGDPAGGRQPVPGQVEDEPVRLGDRDGSGAGGVLHCGQDRPGRWPRSCAPIRPGLGTNPTGSGYAYSRSLGRVITTGRRHILRQSRRWPGADLVIGGYTRLAAIT
jgi:hypothetical protein